MPNMMQLKPFTPVDDGPARLNNAGNKAGVAIRLALRPCGVTAYEASDAINAIGGSAYSPSYTKSAQFARSYYGQMSFGCYGVVERVGDHVACVRAYGGDDAATEAWQALPEQLRDNDAQLLVIYAYAAQGKAVGRYGSTTLSDLPADADDAAARRAKLGRRVKRNQRGGGQRQRSGQSGQRSGGSSKGGSQRKGQQSKAADADAVASALTGQTGDTGQSVEPQGDSQGHADASAGEGQQSDSQGE